MNNIKQHQEMGYDRASSMFSPDGLLLQVEYAEKAVNLGSTTISLVTKEGLIFIGDRKIKSKLLVKNSFKKIFEIDEHIIVAGSGVMSDGRRLIEQAQMISQEHRVKFQNEIDLISLIKDISNIKQHYSQSGGLRPFGVSLLIGGIENNKPNLYMTTPSGIYLQFLARGIGRNSTKINEILEEKYTNNMSNKDAIKLSLNIFKEILGEDFSIERFDIVTLDLNKKFKRFSSEEIKKII